MDNVSSLVIGARVIQAEVNCKEQWSAVFNKSLTCHLYQTLLNDEDSPSWSSCAPSSDLPWVLTLDLRTLPRVAHGALSPYFE